MKSVCIHAPWGIRNYIQIGVLVVTLGIGFQFYIHVHQAASSLTITVPRPPGVEGFLPIGALMGWKQFLSNGHWDQVHPAGMVILGFAALVSIAGRKSFCSWFCPIGTLSELLWKLGQRLFRRSFSLPRRLDIALRSCKYALLVFFIWIIMRMGEAATAQFLSSPYYRMADVKMLHFFTRMSATTALILAFLVGMSLIYRNFWCRYFCPYGAMMGLLAILSPLKIRRKPSDCIACGNCSTACPHRITVNQQISVVSPECSGCMDCTLVCPVPGVLQMETRLPANRVLKSVNIGAAIILLFVGLFYLALITGHWQSHLTNRDFRVGLMMIEAPSVNFHKADSKSRLTR